MAKLLIVDDERNIRRSLERFFQSLSHTVVTAEGGPQAVELIAAQPFDLILTDYKMAEVNGLELIVEARRRQPSCLVILMTAYATVENAVAAMKAGAYDYVTKPFSLDQIQHVVERALELKGLQAENQALRETIGEAPMLDSKSPAMKHLFDLAHQAAQSDATILLTGESGTGKNVLSRQIHRWSRRADGPFVVVNCTTLSEELLESELFGHVRGSFTGAIKDKPGRLQAADKGTVFLDEIADLTPRLQAKFLRFVQEQSFERIGSDAVIRVDARIIAASKPRSPSAISVRTCFIASTSSPCGFQRCASAAKTSCRWPGGCCARPRFATDAPRCGCPRRQPPRLESIAGLGTHASCATRWNAPRS
jgi:DNA-binding NtrC family response regulator